MKATSSASIRGGRQAASIVSALPPATIPFPFPRSFVKFLLLICNDPALLEPSPGPETDAMMRECFEHADELQEQGNLIESRKLEAPRTAKTLRIRNGRPHVTDGPFAVAREVLGGFNLIEARDMDEATQISMHFPIPTP